MSASDPISQAVIETISQVLRNSARPVPQMDESTSFSDSIRLDSLDFAVIVVQLEQKLGADPFRQGAQPVATVGEFIQLYKDALAN